MVSLTANEIFYPILPGYSTFRSTRPDVHFKITALK